MAWIPTVYCIVFPPELVCDRPDRPGGCILGTYRVRRASGRRNKRRQTAPKTEERTLSVNGSLWVA